MQQQDHVFLSSNEIALSAARSVHQKAGHTAEFLQAVDLPKVFLGWLTLGG